MKHILSAVVENQPGVLARIVGLISGRGYNIHSLNVAPTQEPDTSHMTMVVPGDDRVLEQVLKQLNKLVDVIKVVDLTEEKFIDRELILAKIFCVDKNRSAVIELATLFNAEIVRVQNKSMTLQIVGNTEKIAAFLELLKTHGILDIARTGVVAVGKSQD